MNSTWNRSHCQVQKVLYDCNAKEWIALEIDHTVKFKKYFMIL